LKEAGPKENLLGDEYMRLYFSHSFTKPPVVAIVPAPDSYDEVRRYIVPAQEGVVLWNSELTRKFGEDWNVDFIIIEPGTHKFPTKPDIIMDVVTRDEVVGCNTEFGGLAYISTIRPVNTIVCTNNFGVWSSTSWVSGTAAHEFIHAMGLGHAFNKSNDLMCSIEGGKPTCSNVHNKSRTPSDFNLASVAKLYGRDGFKIPNNCPDRSCDDKFTADQYMNFQYSPPTTSSTPTTSSIPTTPPTTPLTPTKSAPFVDPNQDPQYYIDRYNNEPKYKEWFDTNFPEYDTIYQAVGLQNPEPEMDKTMEPKILRPLQQVALGISPQDVTCKDDFHKLYKSNGNPICVSKSTAEKLIARGFTR